MLGSTPPVGSANVLPELPPSPPPQGSPRAGGSNQTTGATPAAGGASGAETSAQGAGEKRAGLSDLLEEATVHPAKKQKTDAGKSDPNVAPPEEMFSPDDIKAIKDAKKVVVAGFSSQGKGHTERMFKPLAEADIGAGNTVVLVLPPHWEFDTGNEKKQLDKYKAELVKQKINVVTVQSDKSIWGAYLKHGPSDNVGILSGFAEKPYRDNSQIPLYGQNGQTGQAFRHKDIMQNVVAAAGNTNKITVFEDMDPYLAKAAHKAGIDRSQIVGQSNHLLLLNADDPDPQKSHFKGRSDAFLVKANGNGYDGKIATVGVSSEINTTQELGKSLRKEIQENRISENESAVLVRKKMLKMLMDRGVRHPTDAQTPVTSAGGVMFANGATPESIDRGVYIYINEYTGPLAEHIRERLKGTDALSDEYKKSMFVFCGPGAMTGAEHELTNAMHVAQMANFDVITSAGFGCMSEVHYLITNDAHKGNMILMPIENQHEQQLNADYLLPNEMGNHKNQLDTAKAMAELQGKLDELIATKATKDDDLKGHDIQSLVTATGRTEPKATDKAVGLINNTRPMSPEDADLVAENKHRADDSDRKALRRLNKVMIPALSALSRGAKEVTVKMKFESNPKTLPLSDLIDRMKEPGRAGELMEAKFDGPLARNKLKEFAEKLEELAKMPDEARKGAAAQYLREDYANDKFVVGY